MKAEENTYVATFFKFGTPCNFPGCEELRLQYAMDLQKTASKKGCKACYRMGLARKYKAIITNRLTRGTNSNGN